MNTDTKISNQFIYFISEGVYLISDPELCEKSERTIDIKFNDLANNEKLLDKLQLYYMNGSYLNRYNEQSRAKWFAGYIKAFNSEFKELAYEKMLSNPTVRILVLSDQLFNEIKNIEL